METFGFKSEVITLRESVLEPEVKPTKALTVHSKQPVLWNYVVRKVTKQRII